MLKCCKGAPEGNMNMRASIENLRDSLFFIDYKDRTTA
jgi:hypothetical protein